MRIAQIHGHIAPPGRSFLQGAGQLLRIIEGLAEDQPSPAAVDGLVSDQIVLVSRACCPSWSPTARAAVRAGDAMCSRVSLRCQKRVVRFGL